MVAEERIPKLGILPLLYVYCEHIYIPRVQYVDLVSPGVGQTVYQGKETSNSLMHNHCTDLSSCHGRRDYEQNRRNTRRDLGSEYVPKAAIVSCSKLSILRHPLLFIVRFVIANSAVLSPIASPITPGFLACCGVLLSLRIVATISVLLQPLSWCHARPALPRTVAQVSSTNLSGRFLGF
jgi:hypothetical protein